MQSPRAEVKPSFVAESYEMLSIPHLDGLLSTLMQDAPPNLCAGCTLSQCLHHTEERRVPKIGCSKAHTFDHKAQSEKEVHS